MTVLVALRGLLFIAQPEALAFMLAGAFGWAINDQINIRLTEPGGKNRLVD